MTKTRQNEKTFVIAGVNGDLGQEFAKRLSDYGQVYGLSRGKRKVERRYEHLCADFLKPSEIAHAFRRITPASRLIYLHMIGKFRFEDEKHPIEDVNGDGVDDSTYRTNVLTFANALPFLTEHLERDNKNTLSIVGIGSTSDLYGVPFWQSFTRSKDELRKEFRRIYGLPEFYGRVRTLMVNVSTVDGSQLADERPYISREFCLTPGEVVTQSLEDVLDTKSKSIELSIIKPHPEFRKPDFLSIENVRQRWYRDMYGGKRK